MSKVKLTAGRIEDFECEAGRSQSFLWDTESPGLGLRATSGKAKAYIFQGKLKGQTIRITIGDPKTWSIESARQEARRLKVIIDTGQDPRQVKADGLAAEQAARNTRANEALAAENAARRASITLADAWPEYLKYGGSKRNKRTGEIGWSAAHKRAHAEMASLGGERKKRGGDETKPGPLAPLMPCRLCELTAERLTAWLNQETQTRPTAAALSFRLLRAFAGWANDTIEYSGIIPSDAFVTRKVRDALPKSEAKDGDCLQREQLSAWFEQVKKIGNPVISAYLQGLLLTGARRRELSGLKWTDVDFQWRSLTIRDKVEGTRVIPLTPYLASLLQALPRRNDWVFSSPASKDGKITEPRYAHTDALKAAGLPHVSLHGLRRSFGTLAEWLETPAGITAQIMGHSESALAEKHYRRRPLDLLRMWHDKIEAWILNEAGITYVPDQPRLKAVTVA
ncbi:tyrosine-type recombinase/integrase [Herbaspirillum frisingense]|uniref:tyrosine-type recombinase/integrase n=1 Tax=Herbaspirillum frisingense TaxID=92645 RepID=UPI001F3BA09F|nr:integrase family protein [Herbaspirillum frisingense]UIN20787.1 integrase family protein [Herbaspirillum frisingense]